MEKNYAGILQRWLVVESQKRRESDLKHLEKKMKNEEIEAQKKLQGLTSEKFACIPDAQKATKQLFPKCLYHQLTGINIQQVEDNKSEYFCYQIQGKVTVIAEKVEQEKNEQVNL
ncbi:MAG: IS1634 family transposase, partial [Okeania sp. SIO3C4]|nr:IS1634 family transposase [Okeania sp. SIO3C4]